LIKAIIATIIAGTVVGFALLWLEYNYFIPALDSRSQEESPVRALARPCAPGFVFQDNLSDGSSGPFMVIIPAGQFQMGNILNLGYSDEQPVHWVSIDRFAIGRHEVTFAEYDRFAIATGMEPPDDQGWGRGNRPVINVSLSDAIAYADWLTLETGYEYRLPTEVEWEYAARAKTKTQYWWGEKIGFYQANCDGCGSSWDNKKTAPVGSFSVNPFNLYDMLGNVYEWTCSEYEERYTAKEQYCLDKPNRDKLHVLRGGSWYSLPRYVRVSARSKNKLSFRDFTVGFRLVSLL
jgi:formylglycine-generating enzyme required for sulfatase activity